MNHQIRILAAAALVAGLVSLPQSRAADEKGSKAEKPKATDWSGFVTVSTITGEVVGSSANGVTVRVSWYAAGSANNGNGNGNSGQQMRRPQLGGNSRQMYNPFQMRRPSGGGQPQVHLEHHDYNLVFAPQGLVRNKVLPPNTGDNGKAVPRKPSEIEELKNPPGAPGYAAETADLTTGTIAEFTLVRDRDVPAAKATETDLKIKYAVILGKNPNPSVTEKKKN